MKATLALLLTAGPAFGASPIIRLAPTPALVSPAIVAAPFALQAAPAMAFSAPSAAVLPRLASPLAPAPAAALSAPAHAAPASAVPALAARALPALSAMTVLPAASAGDAFDGAFAERKHEEARAVQHAHAEIPVVDYVRGAYGEDGAREFMEGVYAVDEKTSFSGKELLSFLVTPEALNPDLVPDPDRVDFSRLGRSSARIRAIVEDKGMPYHPYERIMTEAFREGLIYRLYNRNDGFTYYGVPPRVRADWGLEPAPEAAPAAKAPVAAGPTPFSAALTALAADAMKLPKDEELFEFTAQAIDAAIKAGKLPPDAVTKAFRKRADALGYDVPGLADAVITLAESAEETPWEARTAALRALLD